jgi:hypothetical protein
MSDANQSSRFSVSTVVTVLVVLLLFAGLVWFLTHQRESIAASEPGRSELRLKNLNDLNTENQKTLTSYRWIDKGKGIVGIPIDRAMELEVADLAANHPHAAGPITLSGPSPTPSVVGSPGQKPASAPTPTGNQSSPSPAGAVPSATTPAKP